MIGTVAVATDGSDTAAKAVELAPDLASRYEAEIVFISAFKPVADSQLKREARDAPDDVQWQINPSESVEPALRDQGDRRPGREALRRRPRHGQQGHVAQSAGQRARQRLAQGGLLRAHRQDDLIRASGSRTGMRA
jgi:nucleotide-binding universal stress UspA family protein